MEPKVATRCEWLDASSDAKAAVLISTDLWKDRLEKSDSRFGAAEIGVENRRSREWAPRLILSQFKVKTDHRSSHDRLRLPM